jgi:1,6-anhydro-N-acetylmuramate kinase
MGYEDLLARQQAGEKYPLERHPETAEELRAEAEALVARQRKERGEVTGVGLDGKPVRHVGPYESTPEREGRAAVIVNLRKRAAR